MIATAAPTVRVVLYEGAGSAPLGDAVRFDLMRALLEKGYAVTLSRAGGQVSAAAAGTLLVLGRFDDPSAVPAATDGDVRVLFRDIGPLLDAADTAAALLGLVESACGEAQAPRPGGWKPWFPVIDYDRCTNCMQCLSFCLFDVYGVDPGGKIQVRHENHCKTDCPACSRVCPEVAILFPKYRFGPINGDVVNADDLRREAMKVDISALLGGDIYSALRDRSERAKSRFGKERDEDRALKERQRCLEKLTQAMDIPAEVLASLPSLDQIQAKAAAAKARAEEALSRQSAVGSGQ